MKKMEKNIVYKVTPEMLEANGGKVDVKIDATIPAKYFNKKVTLVATPVLKFQNGGEKAYEPKTFQGEKVQGNIMSAAFTPCNKQSLNSQSISLKKLSFKFFIEQFTKRHFSNSQSRKLKLSSCIRSNIQL